MAVLAQLKEILQELLGCTWIGTHNFLANAPSGHISFDKDREDY